jgi:release factor glutamine methyltransferase
VSEALLAAPSIGQAVAAAQRSLASAGCDSPRLDAELLLAEALGVGRERLVLDRDLPLPDAAAGRYRRLLERRRAREPVAYILGRRAFRRLVLAVDRRVLIPRPETELLVEVGLTLARGAAVVDVGTGSGAVALALKHERPDLLVLGTDVSDGALAVAAHNAASLGLDVQLQRADLLAGATAGAAVLANLPYVPDGAALEPEISLFEPPGALFAGADGLEEIRRLVAALDPGSAPLVALELGPEQAATVAGLLRARGYGSVQVLRDLAGLDRVVVGRS